MSSDENLRDVDWDEWFVKLLEQALTDATDGMTEEQLQKFSGELDERLPAAITSSSKTMAATIVEALHDDAPGMLAHRRDFEVAVRESLYHYWGTAFDITEMVIKVASEIGEFFYKKHVPPDGVHDYVFEALGRLTARACRMAEEVLVLLKAGYGQAAMSRWRALHEVAVVANFIQENGEDCAERYFAHEAVETWRAAEEFQEHAETLGYEPYSDEQMAALQAAFDAAIQRYGAQFAGHYGWAHAALRATDPTANADLTTIANSAGLGHMRPYYRMASHPSHAKAKGITFNPDAARGDREQVLLTGPGPAGLADPGSATVRSLVQVVAAFLNSNPGESSGLLLNILLKLASEADDAYLAAHEAVERAS